MKIAILLGVLIGALLVVGYIDKPPTPKQQVYRECMKAHGEINMFSENYCGALQDQYNLNFVCDKTSGKCWVESK